MATQTEESKQLGPTILLEPAKRAQQGPSEAYVRLFRAKIASDDRLRED